VKIKRKSFGEMELEKRDNSQQLGATLFEKDVSGATLQQRSRKKREKRDGNIQLYVGNI